jgi:hypothetical protein
MNVILLENVRQLGEDQDQTIKLQAKYNPVECRVKKKNKYNPVECRAKKGKKKHICTTGSLHQPHQRPFPENKTKHTPAP